MQARENTNNEMSQAKSKERCDKGATEKTFQPGDMVLLRIHKQKRGTSPKLADKFAGPFKVLAQLSEVNYAIADPDTKKQQTVHVNRMKLLPDKPEEQGITREEYDELSGESEEDEVESEGLDEEDEDEDKEEDDTSGTSQKMTRSGTTYTIFHILPYLFLIIGLLGVAGVGAASTPALGALYDCKAAIMKGVFAAPSERTCMDSLRTDEVTKYEAEVRKYHVVRTTFYIYYCDAQHIVKDCDENFWGKDTKEFNATFIPTSRKQCQNAARNKVTRYGRLGKIGTSEWVTHEKKYHCRWFRDDKEKYIKFRLRRVEAMVEGNDRVIQQHITSTKCKWEELSCKPEEQRYGWIIWNRVPHDNSIFHRMGTFLVHQTGNFLMISSLGIGGGIIKRERNLILLDNTYVLKVISNTSSPRNASEKFSDFAENFAKNTKTNVQRELLEGKLAREFMKESQLTSTLAAMLCRINAEVHKLQMLNLHSFPDTVGEMLYAEKGVMIAPRGDAYMVRQCQKITSYKIVWDQKLGQQCYLLFPVLLPKNQTKYLELSTRRLLESSAKINCESRNPLTYIRDKNNAFWRYKLGKRGFKKIDLKDHYFQQRMVLPKLQSYDAKLLHYEGTRPHRTTLLEILAAQQENLQTLTDYRTIGEGDILKGLASAMGDVVETITKTTSNIFRIITDGTTEVTNDTVTAVNNIETALVDLVTFSGGPSNFILYILDLCIIVYLVFRHVRGNRQNRQPPPVPEHGQDPQPPPVPEHQGYLVPVRT